MKIFRKTNKTAKLIRLSNLYLVTVILAVFAILCNNNVIRIAPLELEELSPMPPTDTHHADPKTHSWKDWPAIAHKEVGHPLVMKGDAFFNHAREHFFTQDKDGKTLMDEFLEVYSNRPDKTNMCGIRINHAMALYLGVKKLQPTLVVESGVNAGQSTYFIRAASKTTKIFAIDPLDKPICNQADRWMDSSQLTTYYTGEKFVDIVDLDWKGMIKKNEVDPQTTLVFIDDHMHVYDRMMTLMEHGIRHVISEDNYKAGEGSYYEK